MAQWSYKKPLTDINYGDFQRLSALFLAAAAAEHPEAEFSAETRLSRYIPSGDSDPFMLGTFGAPGEVPESVWDEAAYAEITLKGRSPGGKVRGVAEFKGSVGKCASFEITPAGEALRDYLNKNGAHINFGAVYSHREKVPAFEA